MNVLCRNSDQFYFVTRKELTYNQQAITEFKPYVIEVYTSKKWASTETKGLPATIYVIESNKETYHLLMKYADALYDWIAPNLPEDLTFIKNNFIWFSCSSHEEFSGFTIRSDYWKKIIFGIDGLKIERMEC